MILFSFSDLDLLCPAAKCCAEGQLTAQIRFNLTGAFTVHKYLISLFRLKFKGNLGIRFTLYAE